MKWEYKVVSIKRTYIKEDASDKPWQWLTDLGGGGWELLHVSNGWFFFKREKPWKYPIDPMPARKTSVNG